MDLENDDLFTQIVGELETDSNITKLARPGLCRIWTGTILSNLRGRQETISGRISAEARQINVMDSFSHSFVRVIIDGESYFMDGTGVNMNLPYFGLEQNAPEHLMDSYPDEMINTQEMLSHSSKERFF